MTPKKPTREAGARAGDAQVSPKRVKKPQGGPERVQRGTQSVKKGRLGVEERRRLAAEVVKEALAAKITFHLDGDWVRMEPAPSSELLLRAAKCGDELAELVRRMKPKPKVKAKAVAKSKAGAGRLRSREANARITLEAKPVKVVKAKPWGASHAMPDGQQERFCQLMADGRYSQRSCYAQAYGCENDGTARTNGSRLLTNANIRARIDWLKAESLKNWKCEKEEVMRFLHQVITTPVGYVDEESPLAQEVQREEMQMGGARGQLKRGQAESGNEEESPPVVVMKIKIKTPGKVEAAKLLAQMQGWEKPKEMNLTVNYEPPNAALERMMGKGIDVTDILKKAGVLK